MHSLARPLDDCLAALGTDRFAALYCDLVQSFGVAQIMVFGIGPDSARCHLSRHFSAAALGDQLAADYLDGWYRDDPLLADLQQAAPGTVALRRFDQATAQMTPAYRARFFDGPGLRAKTTVLAVGARLRLFVNLYHGEAPPDADTDLLRLVGRLALMHFESAAQTALPEPLAVLSARERAVCQGILTGQKAEAIAAELGVAASTVVTYRRRAYDKLGVRSRAGLFAICRS